MQSPSSSKIECPLCSGVGELSRAEILDRLGVRDFARIAQLSAEEAFRLLTQKHRHEEQGAWSRFETELARRTAEVREQHKDELRLAMSEKETLARRVEDCLRVLAEVRERNQELEAEMAKVARIGDVKNLALKKKRGLGLESTSVRSCLRMGISSSPTAPRTASLPIPRF